MLDLDFSVMQDGEITGFELGYISFYNVNGSASPIDCDNRPVMIFLTISELLFGIADFVKNKLQYKEIGGVDSSMTFALRRHNAKKNKELTELYVNKVLIAKESDIILLKLFYDKSLIFCNRHLNINTVDNAVKDDSERAFIRVREVLL